MSIASRLKIESRGMFATFIFYAVVGVIFLVLLPITDFPPHIAIMGISSLVAAYGIFQKRKWALWLVVIMFFVATAFSLYMTYYYITKDYLLGLSTTAYLILTWIFTGYAASKRGMLET
jgi:hypothetical protein